MHRINMHDIIIRISEHTDAGSLMTEAVRPAALLPFPDVYTPMGATFSTNFNS